MHESRCDCATLARCESVDGRPPPPRLIAVYAAGTKLPALLFLQRRGGRYGLFPLYTTLTLRSETRPLPPRWSVGYLSATYVRVRLRDLSPRSPSATTVSEAPFE
ncbi:hypothetical protein MRX96_023538 [Rhipicephalus microplus]